MVMLARPLILVVLGMAAAAPAARADVLVSKPTASTPCGQAIRTGVWYRDFPASGGDRGVTIEVRSASGAVLERRRVTATSAWRYFRYQPRCGRHYGVRYVTAAGATVFRIWVRKG